VLVVGVKLRVLEENGCEMVAVVIADSGIVDLGIEEEEEDEEVVKVQNCC
jgi:hypothetical protein